jgi:hypothetical protein
MVNIRGFIFEIKSAPYDRKVKRSVYNKKAFDL